MNRHRTLKSILTIFALVSLALSDQALAEIPNDAIQNAVGIGDMETVARLLETGFPVDSSGKDGTTILMFASLRREAPIVRLLLKKGANVGLADGEGNTALMWGALGGLGEVCEALIKAGADVTKANNDGDTALALAAVSGSYDCLKALVDKRADIAARDPDNKTTILMMAISGGNTQSVEYLIRAGADVNAKTPEGITALRFAKLHRNLRMMQALMDAGARR